MTPLAAHFCKQLVLRRKHRSDIKISAKVADGITLRELMSDIHCFDMTDAWEMVLELDKTLSEEAESNGHVSSLENLVFLPAPKTWIEFKSDTGRMGILLVSGTEFNPSYGFRGPLTENEVMAFIANGDSITELRIMGFYRGKVSLINSACWGTISNPSKRPLLGKNVDLLTDAVIATAFEALAIINTPRIVGRRQHMPNRALERILTQKMGSGSFPLHAWTEVVLSVSKPVDIDDGLPHEAHLTGSRALHFVRKHIRIRNGVLQYVSAHWRGDPSIGIKQSRYKVVA